jgi:hypothetical protein
MPRLRLLAVALALLSAGCASAWLPAPAGVVERAQATPAFSARLRVSLKGPELRARTQALIAFQRPDALRIEVPGPSGLRLVAVTRESRLVAVFPGERAYYSGAAEPTELVALLGLELSPGELMDLLVGVASPRLRRYRVRWGEAYPREIDAELPDGARLKVKVDDPEPRTDLPAAAFEPPPYTGYREVSAREARGLWRGR